MSGNINNSSKMIMTQKSLKREGRKESRILARKKLLKYLFLT